MCTLGSVREEVIVGYGEPKRARNWKRSIQPRGYLRAYAGFLYSAQKSSLRDGGAHGLSVGRFHGSSALLVFCSVFT